MISNNFFILCGLLAAIAVPMALKMVPPNSLYGFHTSETNSSTATWYLANAFAGWAIVCAAMASATLRYFAPQSLVAQSWFPILALVIPLIIAVMVSLVYVNRLKSLG